MGGIWTILEEKAGSDSRQAEFRHHGQRCWSELASNFKTHWPLFTTWSCFIFLHYRHMEYGKKILPCLNWMAKKKKKAQFLHFKHADSTWLWLPYAVTDAKQSVTTCQSVSKMIFFPWVLMMLMWSLKPYPEAQPKAFGKCLLYVTGFTAPCFPGLYLRLFFQNEIITNHTDAWIQSWTWLFMRQNITLISWAPGMTGSLFSFAL